MYNYGAVQQKNIGGVKMKIRKRSIISLICVLIVLAAMSTVVFADTYTGTIKGYPYTYWFLRETTSQGYPCISTTFKWQLEHYSSAATYVGSVRKHYSGRNWVGAGNLTSRAYSTYNSIYAYTSAYYGTEE